MKNPGKLFLVLFGFSLLVAVSCGPRTSAGYRDKAIDLMAKGEYLEAIRLYRKAMLLEENPEIKGKISCEMGMALYEIGHTANAVEALEQGLKLSPDYTIAYGVLGAAYNALDPAVYRDQIKQNLNRFIEREPNSAYVPQFQEILDRLDSPAPAPGVSPVPAISPASEAEESD